MSAQCTRDSYFTISPHWKMDAVVGRRRQTSTKVKKEKQTQSRIHKSVYFLVIGRESLGRKKDQPVERRK